jgi:drug/metabolite transporter (DMT)-like permease
MLRVAHVQHRDLRTTAPGTAAILLAVVTWSFSNTLVKVSQLPALTFAFWRLWMGAAVLLAATRLARRSLTWEVVRESIPGGILLGTEIALFFSAIKRTSIVDVTIIAALQPALVLIVAGPLFGERVTRRMVALTLVSVLGVAIVAKGSESTSAWSLAGDLLAAGSLIAWTAYFLVSKHARATVNALEYLTVVSLTAAVVVTPMTLLSGQSLAVDRPADWMWLCVFVVAASGGHLLVAWAHGHVDVSVSSMLMLAQPVVSALAALLVLGQPVTPPMIVGGAIVVVSLAAIVGRAAGLAAEEEPPPQ